MKKRRAPRRKSPLIILPKLKRAGTIGTMQEYRSNVAEFSRLVRNAKRKATLTPEQQMDELITLNKMLATLYDMQEKFEKKVVKQEGTEEQEEEIVEIKKCEVTVTVPKEPEMHEDKESLVHSPEFGAILKEMPVQLVVKKKEPVPEPEVHPALKEIFQS